MIKTSRLVGRINVLGLPQVERFSYWPNCLLIDPYVQRSTGNRFNLFNFTHQFEIGETGRAAPAAPALKSTIASLPQPHCARLSGSPVSALSRKSRLQLDDNEGDEVRGSTRDCRLAICYRVDSRIGSDETSPASANTELLFVLLSCFVNCYVCLSSCHTLSVRSDSFHAFSSIFTGEKRPPEAYLEPRR